MIHTFSSLRAVHEKLFLAIEIMVKCSHALNWPLKILMQLLGNFYDNRLHVNDQM